MQRILIDLPSNSVVRINAPSLKRSLSVKELPYIWDPSKKLLCSFSSNRGREPQTGDERTNKRQQASPLKEEKITTLLYIRLTKIGEHLCVALWQPAEQESNGRKENLEMSCTINWPNCMSNALKRLSFKEMLALNRSLEASRALGRSLGLVP
uniref:Uncharacterized protein n=1 Tax=Romanomermis culicivorax TaxID=13658 RepID=A0A915HHH1_ROMCU